MRYVEPIRKIDETRHPSDVAQGGVLVRSAFLDTPSGSPLALLEPRARAIFLLVQAGEDPSTVGMRLTRGPRADAHLRALRIMDQARAELGITPTARARMSRLRAIVPDELMRWTLLLRASGAFDDMTELAGVLGCHRASVYRRRDAARALIETHVKENPAWAPVRAVSPRRSRTNPPATDAFAADVNSRS